MSSGTAVLQALDKVIDGDASAAAADAAWAEQSIEVTLTSNIEDVEAGVAQAAGDGRRVAGTKL